MMEGGRWRKEREGGRRQKGREGTGTGWGEKRSEVKADVNTNAKFLVMVMCDMSHVTQLKIQKWSVFNLLHFYFSGSNFLKRKSLCNFRVNEMCSPGQWLPNCGCMTMFGVDLSEIFTI